MVEEFLLRNLSLVTVFSTNVAVEQLLQLSAVDTVQSEGDTVK